MPYGKGVYTVGMTLSEYAKHHRVTYRTAWNRFKAGKIEGAVQLPSGRIFIPDPVFHVICNCCGSLHVPVCPDCGH